jgi:hypothetical protein
VEAVEGKLLFLSGQHEATLLNTWIRSANLRWWISRPDCPAILREFQRLFSLFLGVNLGDKAAAMGPDNGKAETRPAHFKHDGVNYSRATTHIGNSLILYLDPGSGKSYAGSIEEIVVGSERTEFKVRPQAPLPPGKNDPFKAFPYFPAETYSSKMMDEVVSVEPHCIIGHCACFEFSDEQAVILTLSRVFSLLSVHTRIDLSFQG